MLADPAHPDHRDSKRWVGKKFDPERSDLAAANKKLAVFGRRMARALRLVPPK